MIRRIASVVLTAALSSGIALAQGERIWRPDSGATGGDPTRSSDPQSIAALKCSRLTNLGRNWSLPDWEVVDANGHFDCQARRDTPNLGSWYYTLGNVIFATVNTCTDGKSPSPITGVCTDNPDAKKNTGSACPCTDNPINAAVGNRFLTETDYTGRGPFPLSLERTYNSTTVAARSSGFGGQWAHSYRRSLNTGSGGSLAAATSVIANRGDGKGYLFVKTGTVFKADADVPFKLSLVAGVWSLTDERDTVETYDSTGKLLTITRRDGQRQTLAYDASNRLLSVTDDYGRSLGFEYDAQQHIMRITDPAAGTYEYGYDQATDMLLTVQYPDGRLRRYHYEVASKPALLTGITAEDGVRFATYGYDAQDRATTTVHAGGADAIAVVYNASGASLTDPLGTVRQFDFASNHGLVKNNAISGPCTGCGATAAATSYDANGYVASTTDFGGTTTTFVHDARGLETSRTEAVGTAQARTITTGWHATLRLPLSVTEPGRETTYTYDANGNRLTMAVRDTATNSTRTTTWTYNAVGQVLTMDGPRSDVSDLTTYAYDADGNLSEVTNALDQTTAITEHDAHGNPTRIEDANGVVTTLTYDPRQRLLTRTVTGVTTTFEYDPNGQLTKLTQPGGAFLSYDYDAAHRLVAVEDNFGNRIAYTLDAAGNRIGEQVLDPGAAVARSRTRDYDALSHLIRDEDGTGRGTAFGYDLEGKRTSSTDDLDRSTGFDHDALDRLTLTTDAADGLTHYAYDARDNLTQVIDPRDVTTGYSHDGFDGLTTTASPDAGTASYAYDAAGNRAQQTDARGITATFEYDALNRLTAVRYPNAADDVVYGYDEGTNGIGRLTSITDPSGETHYEYDARGNLIEDARVIGTTALTVHYAYDAADRLIEIVYPSGRTVGYARDAAGRISDVRLEGLPDRDLATSLLHEPFGPVAGLVYGNGLVLSRQFDLGGRLAAQSAGSLQQLGWTYDDAGNITGLSDGAQPGRSQTFEHDALDRLTEASGAYGTQQFDYDAAGNRLSLTDDSAITSYTYATASNRLLTAGPASYQYDANGNTTADGTDVFTFNQANRLATVTRAGQPVATYTYNALGQRVRKDASLPSAVQTLFVYDLAGHLIGEYAANGTMLVEHVWLEDMPLAQLRPDGTGGTTIHWYLTDHLDTPTQLTDENQQVVWDAVREPFGTTALVVSTVSNNLRFPGQYEDAETGQHYNYFRDYDPSTGRYVASDPIGLLAGLNTYSYAWETPLEVVDPKGLIGFALRNELRRGPHRIPTQDAIRISNNLSVIEAASTAAAAIAPIAAVAVVEGGAPLCAAAGAAAPRVAQACRHPVMAAVLGASICGNMAGTVSGTARNYARDRDRIQEIVNAATRTPRRNTGSASVPPP
jgi:RHS repeat-associated protein